MKATLNGIDHLFTDSGRGLPLFFVHGFPLSGAAWRKQADAFHSSHRVIVPDLRGFGGSDATSGPVTMTQFAKDLHSLLHQLAAGPAVLIGHSMGGYVTLAFAREFPNMVRGLVLVGTKAGADTPEAAAGRHATAEKVLAEGTKSVVDSMAPKMFGSGNPDAAKLSEVRNIMSAAQPAGVAGALLGMAERPDSTQYLDQIAVPTLIVAGSADKVIPPTESEKLAAGIRGSELKIIPGAGHLVPFEQPEAFNRVLGDWLGRLAPSAR